MRCDRLTPAAVVLGLLALAGGTPARAAPAAAAATAGAASPRAAAPALPWIEDDLARALVQGRERSLPLFVESWAPW